MPKTVIDIEEERAIRDICYKSGKYEINHSFLKSNTSNAVNFGLFCCFFFFPSWVMCRRVLWHSEPLQTPNDKICDFTMARWVITLGNYWTKLAERQVFWFLLTVFATSKIAVTGRNYCIGCTSSPLFKFSENKIKKKKPICICQQITKILHFFLPHIYSHTCADDLHQLYMEKVDMGY